MRQLSGVGSGSSIVCRWMSLGNVGLTMGNEFLIVICIYNFWETVDENNLLGQLSAFDGTCLTSFMIVNIETVPQKR